VYTAGSLCPCSSQDISDEKSYNNFFLYHGNNSDDAYTYDNEYFSQKLTYFIDVFRKL
jgi:hypothetical protein